MFIVIVVDKTGELPHVQYFAQNYKIFAKFGSNNHAISGCRGFYPDFFSMLFAELHRSIPD